MRLAMKHYHFDSDLRDEIYSIGSSQCSDYSFTFNPFTMKLDSGESCAQGHVHNLFLTTKKCVPLPCPVMYNEVAATFQYDGISITWPTLGSSDTLVYYYALCGIHISNVEFCGEGDNVFNLGNYLVFGNFTERVYSGSLSNNGYSFACRDGTGRLGLDYSNYVALTSTVNEWAVLDGVLLLSKARDGDIFMRDSIKVSSVYNMLTYTDLATNDAPLTWTDPLYVRPYFALSILQNNASSKTLKDLSMTVPDMVVSA